MNSNHGAPFWPIWILAGIVIGLVMSIGFPWSDAAQKYWLGGDGILSVVVSAATLVGVAAAARGVFHSMREGNTRLDAEARTQRFSQFERALGMLGSEKLAIKNGGIEILRNIAVDRPDEFAKSVTAILSHFASDTSADDRAVFTAGMVEGLRVDTTKLVGHTGIIATLDALSEINSASEVYVNANNIAMYSSDMMNLDMSGARISNAAFYNVKFRDGNFSKATVRLAYACRVAFQGCDLEDSEVQAQTWGDDALLIQDCDLKDAIVEVDRELTLVRCRVDGAKISGTRVTVDNCWTMAELPTFVVGVEQGEGALPILVAAEGTDFSYVNDNIPFPTSTTGTVLVNANASDNAGAFGTFDR